MPLAGLCSLALGSLQAGQESVNNLQALSDTGCNLPSRDGGWGYCGADSCNIAYTTCPGDNGGGPPTVDGVTGTWADGYSEDYCNDFYDLSAQTTVDPEPSLYAPAGARPPRRWRRWTRRPSTCTPITWRAATSRA